MTVATTLRRTDGGSLTGVPDLCGLAPAELSRRTVLPLRGIDGRLCVALGDIRDERALAWLDVRLSEPYDLAEVVSEGVWEALSAHDALAGVLQDIGTGGGERDPAIELTSASLAEASSPAVRLVASTLVDALRAGASDIHFEAVTGGLAIKFRIDGELLAVGGFDHRALAEQVVSRIKVLAELDIAESRTPQDGRFKARIGGREIDFRVSVMPSLRGEDVVLRILDRERLARGVATLRLENLGFDGPTCARLRHLASLPHGMLLLTGPTGSGKTTSLYAALMEVVGSREKTVTIEDPVEYQLPGVLQIPVNDRKGLTFARGLRSILRHDPDRIMVGEIRDSETAEIAIQAALTGHPVLSTVHANGVFDVVQRFISMGVDGHGLVSAINGIAAQRLLRLNCPECVRPAPAPAGFPPGDYREAPGCAACRGSGFRGRQAVAEILEFDDALREAVAERASLRRLKALAGERGWRGLRAAATDLARCGAVAPGEVLHGTMAC